MFARQLKLLPGNELGNGADPPKHHLYRALGFASRSDANDAQHRILERNEPVESLELLFIESEKQARIVDSSYRPIIFSAIDSIRPPSRLQEPIHDLRC